MKKLLLLAMVLGFLVSGCATIVRGTHDSIGINSHPSSKVSTDDGGKSCITPCAIKLWKNESHILKFEKEGYVVVKEEVKPTLCSGSLVILGNAIFGGVIGLITDLITGGWLCLEPENVCAELQQISAKAGSFNEKEYIEQGWKKVE